MKKVKRSDAVTPETASTPATGTVAQKLWEKLENMQVEMFALPGQTVKQYCEPIPIEDSKLYLKPTKAPGAFLPALETALGNSYNIELVDQYIVVSQRVKR